MDSELMKVVEWLRDMQRKARDAGDVGVVQVAGIAADRIEAVAKAQYGVCGMSTLGITKTVLATGLAEAVLKDEAPEVGGFDLSGGMFGPHVSKWIHGVAEELEARQTTIAKAQAEREPVATVYRDDFGNICAEFPKDFYVEDGAKLFLAPPSPPSVEGLLHAGVGLSNIAFNLAQFDVIAADYRAQLQNAAKKWDTALAAYNKERGV